MKLLILGGRGMAGHMIRRYFEQQEGFDVLATSRDPSDSSTIFLNVLDEEPVHRLLTQIRPDVVINATGLLNQAAERHHEEAIRVNGLLPHRLADWSQTVGFKFIHISTDCVFSGLRGGYTEADKPDGSSWYARTKTMGEIRDDRGLTFRTSIIGPEIKLDGIGLFGWFMRQKGTVRGYANVYWTGVTTLELAKAIHAAILQNLSGLYHLVLPRKISKYHLLMLMQNVYGKNDVAIVESSEPSSDKSLISTRTDFAYDVPEYEDMLIQLKQFTSQPARGALP